MTRNWLGNTVKRCEPGESFSLVHIYVRSALNIIHYQSFSRHSFEQFYFPLSVLCSFFSPKICIPSRFALNKWRAYKSSSLVHPCLFYPKPSIYVINFQAKLNIKTEFIASFIAEIFWSEWRWLRSFQLLVLLAYFFWLTFWLSAICFP